MTPAQHHYCLKMYKRCALCGAPAEDEGDKLRALCECDHIITDFRPGVRVRTRERGWEGTVRAIVVEQREPWVSVYFDRFQPHSILFRPDRLAVLTCLIPESRAPQPPICPERLGRLKAAYRDIWGEEMPCN